MARSLYKSAHRFASYIVLGKHLFPPWSASGHGSKAPFNSRYDNSTISAPQQRSFHTGKGKKKKKKAKKTKNGKYCGQTNRPSSKRKISQCTLGWGGCLGRTGFLRIEIIRYRNDSWAQGNTRILQKYPKPGNICDLFSLLTIALFPSSRAEGDLFLGAEQTGCAGRWCLQGWAGHTLLTLCPPGCAGSKILTKNCSL